MFPSQSVLKSPCVLQDELDQLLTLLLGKRSWVPPSSRAVPPALWVHPVLGQHGVRRSEVGILAVLLAEGAGDVLSLGARRPKRADGITGERVQAGHGPHDIGKATAQRSDH